MGREFNNRAMKRLKNLYNEGYRCINYEINERDDLFTVYLKNFEREDTETLKCNVGEGMILRDYIDRLS